MRRLLTHMLVLGFCAGHAGGQAVLPDVFAATNAPSPFRSAEDGWFDVSGFLDEEHGFLPVVLPITEPAVGYGAAGGLAFISKPLGETQAGFGRPNVTVVGGLATGFRYELARKYGIHMGLDVAFGPDSPATYVQVGSAWARP